MDYNWLVFAHVLGVVIFAAGHGISMAMLAMLRNERNPDRLRAMLDMSLGGLFATYGGLLLIIVSGVWLGFEGGFWGQGWLWTSIAILVAITVFMMFVGVTHFGRIREAVGLQPYRFTRQVTLGPIASEADIAALAMSPKVGLTMSLGTLALIALLILMTVKPF
jgi:uncharacterized membrane protein